MRKLFMAVMTLLFASMPRLYAESTAPGNDTYVLYVEQIECDASHMQMQDVAANQPPAVNMISHEEIVAFPDATAVKFPDLELVPGKPGEIDRQKPVKYPTAFDAEGKPTEFSSRGVGVKISASISEVTNCIIPNISTGVNQTNTCVSLRFILENVTGPLSRGEVEKVKTANPQIQDNKGPCFQSKNMIGEIKQTLGQWVVLGGSATGESRYLTWYLKVDKK